MRKLRHDQQKSALTILLVGQHPVILQAMKSWLAPLGHKLVWVKNGLEAIREIRLKQFDLIMTELVTPGLDSSLVSQYLRNIGDRATIIGLSPNWYQQPDCDLALNNPGEIRFMLDSVAYAAS